MLNCTASINFRVVGPLLPVYRLSYFCDIFCQNTQFFVTLFPATTHPSLLKFGMQAYHPQLYCKYQFQGCWTSTSCLTDLVTFGHFLSILDNFRNIFLSNYLSQPLEIWYASLSRSTVLQVPISGLLDLYFLFTDLVTFATFFVNFR